MVKLDKVSDIFKHKVGPSGLAKALVAAGHEVEVAYPAAWDAIHPEGPKCSISLGRAKSLVNRMNGDITLSEAFVQNILAKSTSPHLGGVVKKEFRLPESGVVKKKPKNEARLPKGSDYALVRALMLKHEWLLEEAYQAVWWFYQGRQPSKSYKQVSSAVNRIKGEPIAFTEAQLKTLKDSYEQTQRIPHFTIWSGVYEKRFDAEPEEHAWFVVKARSVSERPVNAEAYTWKLNGFTARMSLSTVAYLRAKNIRWELDEDSE